jgi:hypothetical protein
MIIGEQQGAVPDGDPDLEILFEIRVYPHKKQVTIEAPEKVEFMVWMMACEFLLHKTAQKSFAGYERALDLLQKGAMTYKTIKGETDGKSLDKQD